MTTTADPFAGIPNASGDEYTGTELETGQERRLQTPAQTCDRCGLTLRSETDAQVMKAHLDTQHYSTSRFPVPEPYALLVELSIRPGQTAHQLAAARSHRVTYRGRRTTYDGCVSTALEAMLAAGTARYEDVPGGRGRAGFHRLWYAAVRP